MSGHLRADLGWAQALFTTRQGGVSDGPYASLNLGLWTEDDPAAVAENRRRAGELAGRRELAQGRQVHGTAIHHALAGDAEHQQADGQVATDPALAPIVLTADCLPIAVAAPGVVAMLHAGWRGVAGGIVEAGVAALRAWTGAEPLVARAVIGPGAGPCCYEVGDDVAARFDRRHRRGRLLDLKAAAADRLRAAGVTAIEDVGRCTMCEPETFFSHRRSGPATGRQAGIAWLS